MEKTRQVLAAKFQVIFPHLDERQRRLLMGAEASALGHGGIRVVAQAAGVREATVSLGAGELDSGAEPLGRARRPGSGRKRAADLDPGLRPALLALVEPQERGDPMSPLRWTTKSTRNLAGELTRQGHRVGADTVGDLLRAEGFSLQGNAKTIEGQRHPDRDAQFRYINEQVKGHQGTADPVISVDTKKKELAGEFKNAGRQWRPKGEPAATRTHDFPGDSAGKAVPYGVYDLTANAGWVSVGTDHDTAAFAVESIRRWWKAAGSSEYPLARRLLITADAGGSNGYRTRDLAADIRLPWQRPCPPGRLTPARVRRGFRSIRQTLPDLAGAPKPGKPGPGRPPGSKNRRPVARHDVGKTVKRDEPKKKSPRQKGLSNKLRSPGICQDRPQALIRHELPVVDFLGQAVGVRVQGMFGCAAPWSRYSPSKSRCADIVWVARSCTRWANACSCSVVGGRWAPGGGRIALVAGVPSMATCRSRAAGT
jgi:hypothetical protein